MKKFSLMIVITLLAWYGGSEFFNRQYGSELLHRLHLSDSEKLRCVTKDGKIVYGQIPAGTTCERIEEIKGSLSVIASEFADKGKSSNQLPATPSKTSARFKCDGRTLCSQMNSCEEATFFLNNCPGVQMDGNNDGMPCERQWCK